MISNLLSCKKKDHGLPNHIHLHLHFLQRVIFVFSIIPNYIYIGKGCILLDEILEFIALRGKHKDSASILALNFLNEGMG